MVTTLLKLLAFVPSVFCAAALADTGNNPIHALHYEVEVNPNIPAHSIQGETKLEFVALNDGLDHLSFPTYELKVQSVSVGKKPVRFSSANGVLTIPFGKALKAGQKSQVDVIYEGTPASGIVFGEHSVYTSYDTCHWMICDQDNPGDKASLLLTLNLPKDLKVVASGREVKAVPLPDGKVQHIWKEEQPYSAYLFGFAAGIYQSSHARAGQTSLDFYSESIEPAKLAQIFQDTAHIVEFFEKISGIPFPHSHYAQVVVPGNEAQEVSSYSLLGSNYVEPLLTNPSEDWAIVHELAHEWWGNSITCVSWDHFWLNEGLVVFMTAAYKEARWGKAAYDQEMETARKKYEVAKDAGMDVPLTRSQSLPTLKLRRAIAYSKGALFLDTLRKQMGEASFWSGLKEYSRKYAGKKVESKDFAEVMEAHGNSEVTKLFQTWVF